MIDNEDEEVGTTRRVPVTPRPSSPAVPGVRQINNKQLAFAEPAKAMMEQITASLDTTATLRAMQAPMIEVADQLRASLPSIVDFQSDFSNAGRAMMEQLTASLDTTATLRAMQAPMIEVADQLRASLPSMVDFQSEFSNAGRAMMEQLTASLDTTATLRAMQAPMIQIADQVLASMPKFPDLQLGLDNEVLRRLQEVIEAVPATASTDELARLDIDALIEDAHFEEQLDLLLGPVAEDPNPTPRDTGASTEIPASLRLFGEFGRTPQGRRLIAYVVVISIGTTALGTAYPALKAALEKVNQAFDLSVTLLIFLAYWSSRQE